MLVGVVVAVVPVALQGEAGDVEQLRPMDHT